MGAFFLRLVDAVLFLFFLLVALAVPLIHAQEWLHDEQILPGFVMDLKKLYSSTTGDYLLLEKPLFFVGLVWLELLLLWPLSVANLYGAVASKSWFSTTCLIYGVSVFSAMAAVFGEVYGSGKASEKLLMVYSSFWGFGAFAFLRGLIGNCCPSTSNTKSSTTATKTHAHARKKRA